MPSQARFGNVRFIWIRPPSGMGDECRRRADAIEPVLVGMMNQLQGNVVDYMKTNAPWTDRTYKARDNLDSRVNLTGKGSVTLSAFHGVPYGGFLEIGTNFMSAYPIIKPALEAHYAQTKAIMNLIAGSA